VLRSFGRLLGRYALDLVVCALALGALVEDLVAKTVTLEGVEYDLAPEWLVVGVVCAVPALVVLRRRLGIVAPVAALVLVGATSISARAWLPGSGLMYLLVLLLSGVTGYMVVRRLEHATILVVWAVVTFAVIRQPDRGWDTWTFVMVFMSVAWLIGVAIRRPLIKARAAEERALRLEHEQAFAAQQAVAGERQRIARELHDVIAHSVSVMTVQAGAVRRLLLPEQEKERAALETVEATGRSALTEMRRLVGLLREQGAMPEFSPQPSMKTLDVLIANVREAGLPVELAVEGEPRELPPGVDLSAYRVVQEALTNALKYAGPARAWVKVRWHERELELEIANDGQGTGQGNGSGHGLAGMQERVALVGGTIESGRHPVNGFVVRARLPLQDTV
jgi:signal transduction histidine kinase